MNRADPLVISGRIALGWHSLSRRGRQRQRMVWNWMSSGGCRNWWNRRGCFFRDGCLWSLHTRFFSHASKSRAWSLPLFPLIPRLYVHYKLINRYLGAFAYLYSFIAFPLPHTYTDPRRDRNRAFRETRKKVIFSGIFSFFQDEKNPSCLFFCTRRRQLQGKDGINSRLGTIALECTNNEFKLLAFDIIRERHPLFGSGKWRWVLDSFGEFSGTGNLCCRVEGRFKKNFFWPN